MKRTQVLLFASALWLGNAMAYSDQAVVYKWTDDSGVVQYTSTAPMDREYETINPKTSVSDTASAGADAGTDGKSADDKTKPAEPATALAPEVDTKKRQEYCATAEQNLKTLQSTPRILKTDENGQPSRMTEEERQAEMNEMQDIINRHCN